MGDMVPAEPDDNEFIDNEALKQLQEKVIDVLRPIGLTIDMKDIQYQVHPEHGMVMIIPALVRPSAKQKMTDERETRDEFNKMMAESNEAMVDDLAEEMRTAVEADNLEDILFGDAVIEDKCPHPVESRHPSGHCMDCGKIPHEESGDD